MVALRAASATGGAFIQTGRVLCGLKPAGSTERAPSLPIIGE